MREIWYKNRTGTKEETDEMARQKVHDDESYREINMLKIIERRMGRGDQSITQTYTSCTRCLDRPGYISVNPQPIGTDGGRKGRDGYETRKRENYTDGGRKGRDGLTKMRRENVKTKS